MKALPPAGLQGSFPGVSAWDGYSASQRPPHRRTRTLKAGLLSFCRGRPSVGPSLHSSPVFATLAAALAYSRGLRPRSQGHVRRRSLTSVGQRHCPSLSGPALAGQSAPRWSPAWAAAALLTCNRALRGLALAAFLPACLLCCATHGPPPTSVIVSRVAEG